jgi:hypothetical protein
MTDEVGQRQLVVDEYRDASNGAKLRETIVTENGTMGSIR